MSDDDDLFDPNDPEYDDSGGDYKDLKEPGTYLLGVRAIVAHDRTPQKENGGGNKLYTRLAFVVIDGPHKGESFLDRVFRSPSSYKRLGHVCRAMRITEKFNPSKNIEMERIMLGRALKSSVKVNDRGYAELEWPQQEWEEEELEVMKAWELDFKRRLKEKLEKEQLGASDFDDAPLDDFPLGDLPF